MRHRDDGSVTHGRCHFQGMPTEIAFKVFASLASFTDLYAVASTCRRLRQIWSKSIAALYAVIGPKAIPGLSHARQFLADAGGPTPEQPITMINDVYSISRNATIVEKAIVKLEKEVVRRVRTLASTQAELEECYGPGARGHPACLTQREQRRFVRQYYQLWGLLQLSLEDQQSRIRAMTLKELFCMHEMCNFKVRDEENEARLLSPDEKKVQEQPHPTTDHYRLERRRLAQVIGKHLEDEYEKIHGSRPDYPEVYAIEEGFPPFVVMWDHWQPTLKSMVCGPTRWQGSEQVYIHDHLWDESSEDGF